MRTGLFLICFEAVFTLIFQAWSIRNSEKGVVLPEKGLCAHRGAMATHPENTLPAFKAAIAAGAHMIEFDVFFTLDSQMVVIHDETVDRTTNGKGKVSDLTFWKIRQLDAGIRKSPEFAGVKVPTLDEVLSIMPSNVWLNIHLKGSVELPVMVARKIAAEERLHQAFLACGREAAEKARKAVPEIMICNMDRQEEDEDYVKGTIQLKADFIQLRNPITPALSDYAVRLKQNGIKVNFYGTDKPEEISLLLSYGVDFPLVNDIVNTMKAITESGIQPLVPQFKLRRL